MPDREKILRGAECCKYVEHSQNGCPEECPYLPEEHLTCGLDPLLDDVIALLREQKPVEPTATDEVIRVKYNCGECGYLVGFVSTIHDDMQYRAKFCPECGRKVKWDETD